MKMLATVALALALTGSAQTATVDPVKNTLHVGGRLVGVYFDRGVNNITFRGFPGAWTPCTMRLVTERKGTKLRKGCFR